MRKRILGMLLAFGVLLGLLPAGAMARDRTTPVYVYAQIVDQDGNTLTQTQYDQLTAVLGTKRLNVHKTQDGQYWMTLGMIEDVSALSGETSTDNVLDKYYGTEESNPVNESLKSLVPYTANGVTNTDLVKLELVRWTNLKLSDGADNYVASDNGRLDDWHLDGIIALSDIVGLMVTAPNVEETYDGTAKTVTASVTVTGVCQDKALAHTETIQYQNAQGETVTNPVDAGTYTATVTSTLTGYSGIQAKTTATVTILPRSVTLTSGSAEKEYDGTPLRKNEVSLTAGSFVEGEGLESWQATGSRITAGESENPFTYTLNSRTKAGNYQITEVLGILRVLDRETPYPITLEGNSGEFPYDGTDHSVSGFQTVEFTVNGQKFTVSGVTSERTEKAAGTYDTVLAGTPVVLDAAGNDVTAQFSVEVKAGTLTIVPAEVTIRVDNKSKTFGEADPVFTGTVTGVAPGDDLQVTYGRAPGDAEKNNVGDVVTITASYDKENRNYRVQVEDGTLTIVPADTNTVNASGVTKTYDGQSCSITAEATKPGSTLYYSVDAGAEKTWSETNPAFTDAGEYTVFVYAENPNYEDTAVTSAKVIISRRPVTLTSADAEKQYDETPLTKEEVTEASGADMGFVGDEGVESYGFTGSQTQVGHSENTFSYTLKENTKAENYLITPVYGTLTVHANRITAFRKELLTARPEDVTLPTGITVTYPAGGKVTLPQNGTVTLLYKLTVEADPNAAYTITEEGDFVAFQADGTTIPLSNHAYSGKGTQTIYVARTFTASDLKDGKLTNTASIAAGTGTAPDMDGDAVAEIPAEVEEPEPPVIITTGAVTLRKVDAETGDRLPGARFALYRADGTKVNRNLPATDDKGELKVYNLPRGSYYFVETTAPAGYLLDHGQHEFTISVGRTAEVTVENTRSTVPEGFTTDHYAYIIGYPDGTVRPEGNITRAEVATIFFRLLDEETRAENLTSENGFSDVQQGMWFNTAVSTLANMGILNGYGDGTFRPEADITRAELVKIAAGFDRTQEAGENPFEDADNHWAGAFIDIAVENGWINGYEDDTFKPDQCITRAETMAVVNRVLQRLPQSKADLLPDMTVWPDNLDESAWYYLYVQEATNGHTYERINGCEKWTGWLESPDWTQYEQ